MFWLVFQLCMDVNGQNTKIVSILIERTEKKNIFPKNQIFSGKFIEKFLPMPPYPGCTVAAWDPKDIS